MMYRLYVIQRYDRAAGLCLPNADWQKRWTLLAKFKDSCVAVAAAQHACKVYSQMVARVYQVGNLFEQCKSEDVIGFPDHSPRISRRNGVPS